MNIKKYFTITWFLDFITKDYDLQNIEMYSTLDLKGGIVAPTSYKSSIIMFKNFMVEIRMTSHFFFKESEFEVIVRDLKKIVYHPFSGEYYERVNSNKCSKRNLLSVIQSNIDLGYKRFIKLAAFS